jgi:hypothetical protein
MTRWAFLGRPIEGDWLYLEMKRRTGWSASSPPRRPSSSRRRHPARTAQPADLALGDPAHPRRLDQIMDRAGRDAVDIGLLITAVSAFSAIRRGSRSRSRPLKLSTECRCQTHAAHRPPADHTRTQATVALQPGVSSSSGVSRLA